MYWAICTSSDRLDFSLTAREACPFFIVTPVAAFAIFMLPGGALLLPLLIKLIPDILPSAFREDDDEAVSNESM